MRTAQHPPSQDPSSDRQVKTIKIPAQNNPFFMMPPHELLLFKASTPLAKRLSQQDLTLFLTLHEQSMSAPKQVVAPLQQLLKAYPSQAELFNLLSFVYLSLQKKGRADRLVRQNYSINGKDNPLAWINYADLCLRRGDLKQVTSLLQGRNHLAALFPQHAHFHVGEFRALMLLLTRYFVKQKQLDQALHYFYLAKRVDATHPTTCQVEHSLRKIFAPSPWRRFLARWSARA